jgi:hypothetical protein
MEPVSYFLTACVSFAGLVTGFALERMASEELESIKAYLFLAKRFVLALIFGLVCYLALSSIPVGAVGFILFFAGAIFIARHDRLVFGLLGAAFFAGSTSVSFFPVVASLIFLYGLPTGSLLSYRMMRLGTKKKLTRIIVCGAIFVGVCCLFYLAGQLLKP